MVHLQLFGHCMGYLAVGDEIQEKGGDFFIGKRPIRFQAVFSNGTYTATGTVLENQAGYLMGEVNNLLNLLGIGK